jgi:hypothetical protein
MKKVTMVLVVVVMLVSMVSLVFAAAAKGTIKSVDAKAGTVVFCADGGKDETLKADKAVLGSAKAGDKVEVSIEHGMVMSLKAAKAKASVGC